VRADNQPAVSNLEICHDFGVPRTLKLLAEQAFSRTAGAPLISGNFVRLLRDAGENYPAWLHAIRHAKRWVHFECYIIHDDETGRLFADALIERAHHGVQVRVVFDWLGAIGATSRAYVRRLRQAGIEVRPFNRPRIDRPLAWLSRDHRKVLTADGEVAFVSGLCVGDAWVGNPGRNEEPWRDTGIELRGPAVADVEQAFADVWAATGDHLPGMELPHAHEIASAGDITARVIATQPATAGLYRLDQLVCALARERLWITDAYFVGTPPYVQALIAAAADGVDVRLLVPGSTDLPLVQPMTRSGYRVLLEGGVRVFEWNGTMLHAKTAVADGRWSRVGSTNLNVQSWLGNWELDVAIEDEDFGRQMDEMYTDDLKNATEIVVDPRHRVRRASPAPEPRGRRKSGRWRRRGGTRRTAAGALRLGQTFGAAVTARRALGPAEAVTLVYGAILVTLLAAIGLKWPKALAWPLAVFGLWMAASWIIEAIRVHRREQKRQGAREGGRQGKQEETTRPSSPAGG
jgi:cardiolipin synthase